MYHVDFPETRNRIKFYMEKKSLTESDLARLMQITPQAVSKWLCGNSFPSVENLYLISQILEVSLDDLIVAGAPCW